MRQLDEDALVALVPEQSGLHYVGCPNYTGGRQENQLIWVPESPDEVSCRYCSHRYPSEKYPMTDAVTVRNPRGETVQFPYWADEKGYRYFFQAHRDDEVRAYLAARTQDLALLYVATKDTAHARRAAVLLDRFAQVFPGWCFHYDDPFQQKQIYDGDVPPERFRDGYRTARWNWWAYMDIPSPFDGWVYPYTVVAVESRSDALLLRVGEGPGFLYDATQQRLRLTSFPQREHSGAATVEWNPRAVR